MRDKIKQRICSYCNKEVRNEITAINADKNSSFCMKCGQPSNTVAQKVDKYIKNYKPSHLII